MIAGNYNITAYINRDYLQVFEFDIDITNIDFHASIKGKTGDVNFIITKIDDHKIQLELSKSTIASFEPSTYKWDMKMTAGGIASQIVEGIFKVKQTITD